MPTRSIESAEEICLEAEDWAGELEAWLASHPGGPETGDITSLAAMLRAIVKSIQLSIIADESADDREYLIEELEGTIQMARSLAASPSGPSNPQEAKTAPPPAVDPSKTKPPPPGMSARDILARTERMSDLPIPRQPPKRRS